MCLGGIPEHWLCLVGLDQRFPTPPQSRKALTPLAPASDGELRREPEQNLCCSINLSPGRLGYTVGCWGPPVPPAVPQEMLVPLCTGSLLSCRDPSSSQCWDLSLLTSAASSPPWGCAEVKAEPSPATNTQLWGKCCIRTPRAGPCSGWTLHGHQLKPSCVPGQVV